VHRGRADHAPRLERDTRAHTVFRCRERPIYTPAGVQPATRDLLHAVNTWLGRQTNQTNCCCDSLCQFQLIIIMILNPCDGGATEATRVPRPTPSGFLALARRPLRRARRRPRGGRAGPARRRTEGEGEADRDGDRERERQRERERECVGGGRACWRLLDETAAILRRCSCV
jgi:hypothetical protein